jgi:hypothetical protein
MNLRRLLNVAALLLGAFASLPARAAVVLIDFEDLTPGTFYSNTVIDSFRFSPNCHYDLLPAGFSPAGYEQSAWIGFDGSGCLSGGTYNAAFLGPAEYHFANSPQHMVLWVDYLGHPFTLESVFVNFLENRCHLLKGRALRRCYCRRQRSDISRLTSAAAIGRASSGSCSSKQAALGHLSV